MATDSRLNIYECFDPSGDPVQFICDGHVDSEHFRNKCYDDFFIKPMVVRHQWQKLRKSPARKSGKRFLKGVTKTVQCNPWEMGATPITVGLI